MIDEWKHAAAWQSLCHPSHSSIVIHASGLLVRQHSASGKLCQVHFYLVTALLASQTAGQAVRNNVKMQLLRNPQISSCCANRAPARRFVVCQASASQSGAASTGRRVTLLACSSILGGLFVARQAQGELRAAISPFGRCHSVQAAYGLEL